MKIIIAGVDNVGSTLAAQLCKEGYDLTLIDTSKELLEQNIEDLDVMAVQGNCASMSVLEQAGIQDADLLIAATGADEINLLCCMTAQGLKTDIQAIARIRNPEYAKQTFIMRDRFSLSMIVNPERQAAVEIERLIKYPGFMKRDTFAKGRVEIVELLVDKDSKLRDVALAQLNTIVKCRILVCAVQREGKLVIPDGEFVIREGDRILVTASSANLTLLLKHLDIVTHKAKRVILCGGGRTSYYLAELLCQDGVDVQIIEHDAARCLQLAELLPKACVVQGDASNQNLLDSEGIKSCDALVTLTTSDELNMIVSLYAKRCGVPQVITKVVHTEYNDILGGLSLGSVVCPKELSSNSIVRYVRAMKNQTGAAVTVHSIADAKAEALEFVITEETMHCGEKLRDLKIRPNVLIACINHEWEIQIPDGDSHFEVGDTVIVVVSARNVVYQFNDIFL